MGDWVYVRLRIYRQQTMAQRTSNKLARRYFGPFQVEARIGIVAYKLTLLAESRIHHVFHVSLLRKCHGEPQSQRAPLPAITHEDLPILSPTAVLKSRNLNGILPVLVAWQGCNTHDATWEEVTEIQQLFPSFWETVRYDLEDKVEVSPAGIVTNANIPEITSRPMRNRNRPAHYRD